MEAFMDWKLIYRTAEEMALVSGEILGAEWKSNRLFWDEPENIIFLDLVKRAPEMFYFGGGNKLTVPGRQNLTVNRRLSRTPRSPEDSSDAGAGRAPLDLIDHLRNNPHCVDNR